MRLFSTQVQKYLAWDYNKDTLPGDCHSTAKRCFAMTLSTSYGINKSLFVKKIVKFTYALYAIPCNALYVIARSVATWQSPGRDTM